MKQEHSSGLTPAQRFNGELAQRALRRGAGVAMHQPTQVFLQIASACNLSCYMCSESNRPLDQQFGRGLVSLSPEIFARLEAEVFPFSSQLYLGVGGEPTFSKHFVEYVERAAKARQEIHLTTNGTFFERNVIAEAVVRHVSFVQLSIDAATPANYERIRVGSRWNRLMEGVDNLARLRKGLAPHERCHLTLCFVLMRSNVDELPLFVELAARVGADAVHAQHVIAMTEASRGEALLFEPARYNRARAEAEARARALGVEFDAPAPFASTEPTVDPPPAMVAPHVPESHTPPISSPAAAAHVRALGVEHVASAPMSPAVPPPFTSDAPNEARVGDLADHVVPCRSPTQSVTVLYDGRVFACCHPMAHDKMQLGDLRTQTFAEIWNGRLYRNLRAGLKNGDVPEICRTCSLVHSPPPVVEDARSLAESPDIGQYYDGRDLAPCGDGASELVRNMERAGLLEYVTTLREHADTLEVYHTTMKAKVRRLTAPLRAMQRMARAVFHRGRSV